MNFKISLFYRYQVFTLFLGMFLALPFKLLFNSQPKNEPRYELILDKPKKKYSVKLLIFPSLCDVSATVMDCIGLIYVKKKNQLTPKLIDFFFLILDACFSSSNVERLYGDFHMYFIYLLMINWSLVLISIFLFKKTYRFYHYLAVILILLGISTN